MGYRKYWFRSKRYGWGWYPVTWQGWLVLGLYALYIYFRARVVGLMFDTISSALFRYMFELLLPTIILLVICFAKGEKPKWRWGD